MNIADMLEMLLILRESCCYVLNVADLPCGQVLSWQVSSWRFVWLKLDGQNKRVRSQVIGQSRRPLEIEESNWKWTVKK